MENIKNKNRKSPVSALCSALGTVLLIMLILACIPFTSPKVLGYQAYTVISGSMEPSIPVGSLVYVKGVEPEVVESNDVIAFYGGHDADAIVTHRVVENQVDERTFVTKGDANATKDMNPVSYIQFIGRVELSVPHMGIMAQFLTGLNGKIAAGCLIALALVLHMLASVIEKNKK